jgi:two-component system chemotaxis response regulator CheB
MTAGYTLDRPIAVTCPECGGALAAERAGTLLRYRCHIGHVLTAETTLVASLADIENKLAACLALLNSYSELCRQVAEWGGTDDQYAAALNAAERQARERAEVLRTLLQSEWIQPVRFLEPDGD